VYHRTSSTKIAHHPDLHKYTYITKLYHEFCAIAKTQLVAQGLFARTILRYNE